MLISSNLHLVVHNSGYFSGFSVSHVFWRPSEQTNQIRPELVTGSHIQEEVDGIVGIQSFLPHMEEQVVSCKPLGRLVIIKKVNIHDKYTPWVCENYKHKGNH